MTSAQAQAQAQAQSHKLRVHLLWHNRESRILFRINYKGRAGVHSIRNKWRSARRGQYVWVLHYTFPFFLGTNAEKCKGYSCLKILSAWCFSKNRKLFLFKNCKISFNLFCIKPIYQLYILVALAEPRLPIQGLKPRLITLKPVAKDGSGSEAVRSRLHNLHSIPYAVAAPIKVPHAAIHCAKVEQREMNIFQLLLTRVLGGKKWNSPSVSTGLVSSRNRLSFRFFWQSAQQERGEGGRYEASGVQLTMTRFNNGFGFGHGKRSEHKLTGRLHVLHGMSNDGSDSQLMYDSWCTKLYPHMYLDTSVNCFHARWLGNWS